jgi:hypothetical protein
MKAYGNLENIAAAGAEEIAENCGLALAAAIAVRAAVRLTLEEKDAKIKKFTAKSSSAAALANDAFAAEKPEDYE